MRRLLILLSAILGICSASLGQSSHLLLLSQGDGALTSSESGKVQLSKASFLPKGQLISVRPRSGIETLSSGFQFRFGSDTRFMISDKGIELSEGSIMIRSRKISNTTTLHGPESKIQINGAGCFLVEVETNGGLKAVTILGRLDLMDLNSGEALDLLPGELVFLMPGDRGFAEKVSVNLNRLIESSYLVSGFPNNTSFQSSLASVATAQSNSIGVVYGAEVGDAKAVDSFEVVPSKAVKNNTPPMPKPSPTVLVDSSSSDPLFDLLGRAPKRMKPEVKENQALDLRLQDPLNPTSRPFPSRLLRKN
mgnify:FL=1